MSTLKEKLKLTFDPTDIEPEPITREESIKLLRKFDSASNSMMNVYGCSISNLMSRTLAGSRYFEIAGDSMIEGNWRSKFESMSNAMEESAQRKIRKLTANWFGDEMRIESAWCQITLSTRKSMWISLLDFMWSSILITLSKEECEECFKDYPVLDEISYEKMKGICEIYHKISKMGYFVHRGTKYGDYLLTSWKNPEQVVIANIFEEIR